jgi:hypothetical protein
MDEQYSVSHIDKEKVMKRTTAIVLTILIFLLYGLPSFGFCLFGTQMAIDSMNPAYRAGFEQGSNGLSADIILPIGLGLIGVFIYLIFIPILVGFISFRASKKNEPLANNSIEG